jgi:hypothetical protein
MLTVKVTTGSEQTTAAAKMYGTPGEHTHAMILAPKQLHAAILTLDV